MATSRINALLQFIEEDPQDKFSRYALALEYLNSGEQVLALKHLEELVAVFPDYLATYYQLGKLLESESRNTEAIAVYEKGISIAKSQGNKHTLSELTSAKDEISE
ncbi:MAG: hypothetical protein ABI772_05320 [Bacteroidota bacterium]